MVMMIMMDDDVEDDDEADSHNSSVLPLPRRGVAHTKRCLPGAYSVLHHTNTILFYT